MDAIIKAAELSYKKAKEVAAEANAAVVKSEEAAAEANDAVVQSKFVLDLLLSASKKEESPARKIPRVNAPNVEQSPNEHNRVAQRCTYRGPDDPNYGRQPLAHSSDHVSPQTRPICCSDHYYPPYYNYNAGSQFAMPTGHGHYATPYAPRYESDNMNYAIPPQAQGRAPAPGGHFPANFASEQAQGNIQGYQQEGQFNSANNTDQPHQDQNP